MSVNAEKFMARVDVTDGCWLWLGPTSGAGYGSLWTGARRDYAHRVSYEMFVGRIPDGLEIDHLCRERLCVNPAHLEPVTHAENRRRARKATCKHGHDLAKYGREVKGHGRACRRCDADRAATYRAKRETVCR